MQNYLDRVNAQAYVPLTVTPEALRAALDSKGIDTQREAAEVLGVTEGAVSYWLNGKRPIPPMAAMALQSVPTVRRPSRRRTAQSPLQRRNGRTRKGNTLKG